MTSPQFDGHLESEYNAFGNTAPPSPSPVVLTGHFEPPPVHMPEMGYRHSRTASNDTWELSEAPTEYHVAAGGYEVLACEQSPASRAMKWRFEPYTEKGWIPVDEADSECSAPAPTGLLVPVAMDPSSAYMTQPGCIDYQVVDSVYTPHMPPPTAVHEVSSMPAPVNDGPAVATVQFRYGRQEDYALPTSLAAEPGRHVVVDGDRGEDLGWVVEIRPSANDGKLKRVRRCARDSEVRQWEDLAREERSAVSQAQEIVDKHEVNMRIVHAEYQFDKKKLTFHFNSKDKKPQVKVALSDCFARWRCRIWFSRTTVL